MISALGHPLRRRILGAYLDGTVDCASSRELAEALDEQVGQVAYHLKTLARGEILRPVRDRERQQAQEAHCCWTLDVEAEWLRLVLEIWVGVDLTP